MAARSPIDGLRAHGSRKPRGCRAAPDDGDENLGGRRVYARLGFRLLESGDGLTTLGIFAPQARTMVKRVDAISVAIDLYRQTPAKFTAARNARAKEVAADGDRPLADEIRRFPKPSASAWAINQLASGHVDAVGEFRLLGVKLRDAQKQADRRSLEKLLTRRKELVAGTAKSLGERARECGIQLSPSALSEIEQSLQAALADEDAATAAFSGRLVKAIRSDGLEPVDLSGAIGGPPLHLRPSRPEGNPRPAATESRSSQARADRIARADKAAADADVRLKGLEQQRAELAHDRDELDKDVVALQAQFDHLEQRRRELDARSTRIDREMRKALSESRTAHSDADRAHEARSHPSRA